MVTCGHYEESVLWTNNGYDGQKGHYGQMAVNIMDNWHHGQSDLMGNGQINIYGGVDK